MHPMRRHRQPWPVSQRRIRKMFKFLRVQFLYNYSSTRMSIFFFLLVTFLLLCKSSSRDSADNEFAVESKAAFLLSHQSRHDLFSEERDLSLQRICSRRQLENGVEELRFCGSFPSSHGKKIVGLVEVRNVEGSISSFLSALREVVDSVVIIDDHSTDGSRKRILQHAAAQPNGKSVVEVLLNKTGEWTREELFDRELLLTTGRRVGGTHFVLLDYDEYLSANCVESGLLRRTILHLSPGESLYLPWIELWKSPVLQRVLPDDPKMNFLTRRQTVIYADDGTSHYTKETASARLLGSHARNSTIHVLRCPRTICPKPPKYTISGSDFGGDNRVKRLPQCAILEMRFLNINNVLLKSAWYEALGRVTGADDGATSGKMIDLLFPNRSTLSEHQFRLETVSPSLHGKHSLAGAQSLENIEVWRAEELLRWMDFRGKSTFFGLRSLELIDVDELRNLPYQARSRTEGHIYHIPRRKNRTLVIVHGTLVKSPVEKFLTQIGFLEVKLGNKLERFPAGLHLGNLGKHSLQYEQWKNSLTSVIRQALMQPGAGRAFFTLPNSFAKVGFALLDVIRREFADTSVVILTVAMNSSDNRDKLLVRAKAIAQEVGSHIKLLVVPIENFGSYSAVYWLASRLGMEIDRTNQTEEGKRTILDFVEGLHAERQLLTSSSTPVYAPVGKLIFSLNFGRSGSKYLADVIGTTRGLVRSEHEPLCPDGGCSGGGALRMQNKSLSSSYQQRKSLKLPMIREALTTLSQTNEINMFESRTIDCDASNIWTDMNAHFSDRRRGAAGGRMIFDVNSRSGCVVHVLQDAVYAETNPNFKSWIYDVSLDFFPKTGYDVRVIVLRKYVAALLKSLYETGYFTERDGYNWMETAASVNSRVKVDSLRDDTRLDGYGKILSYLISSEALFRDVIRHYENGQNPPHFLEIRSERLYSAEGTMEVLEWLGLEPTERTIALAGSVRDKYVDGTSKRKKNVSLLECEKRVKQFLESIRDDKEASILRDLLGPLDKVDYYEYPP